MMTFFPLVYIVPLFVLVKESEYWINTLYFNIIYFIWLVSPWLAGMHLHYGDMTDSTCLVKIVSEVQPTEIYNLAAQSHVKVGGSMLI